MRTKKRAQDGLPARAHALSPPERKAPGSETKTSERELRVRRLESGRAHPAGPPGDRGLFTPSRAGQACWVCGPGRGRRQRRGGRRRRRAARPPPGDPGPGVPGGLRRALSLTRAAGGGTAQGRAEDQAGEQKPQQPQVPRGGRRDGRRHPSAPPPGQHGTVRPGARRRLRAPRWRRRRRRRRSGGAEEEEEAERRKEATAAALTLRQRIRDGGAEARTHATSAPARSTCGGGTAPPVCAPPPPLSSARPLPTAGFRVPQFLRPLQPGTFCVRHKSG